MIENVDPELIVQIEAMLALRPMGAQEIIESLCTGPQVPQVRRAIQHLVYDRDVPMDEYRRLIVTVID